MTRVKAVFYWTFVIVLGVLMTIPILLMMFGSLFGLVPEYYN